MMILLSFEFSYENAFLFSQLKDIKEAVWIGFTDIQNEKQFGWTDQSSVTYINWYLRQPDNWAAKEDCVQMMPYDYHKGRWNDVNCDQELGFICMKGKNFGVSILECCISANRLFKDILPTP